MNLIGASTNNVVSVCERLSFKFIVTFRERGTKGLFWLKISTCFRWSISRNNQKYSALRSLVAVYDQTAESHLPKAVSSSHIYIKAEKRSNILFVVMLISSYF